jgi:hypothetical protein
MTYNSGNNILASDVADRFWNDYFSGTIDVAQAYRDTGAQPSGNTPSGKFTVQTWYWQQEVVPRFSNAPNQARGSQPSRGIPASDFTGTPGGGTIRGGTVTGSIYNVCLTEVNRFRTFVNSFRWTSYRTLQTYGPAGQLTVYDSTKKRYALFNEFTPSATNNINSGDSITTSEFDSLFNSFAQVYAAQRAAGSHTQATNYTICHNSCHSSCHRNRGRR